MNGVLKSWAVPKGPSMDPSIKRLAVEVEDHPYEYKDFQGTIPEGNYGAGTVRIWDKGVYASAFLGEGEKELEKAYQKGHISFVLLGKKLQGEFALIRTARADKNGNKRQWLLIKASEQKPKEKIPTISEKIDLRPMLASLTEKPFDDKAWLFETKWDGYRILVDHRKGKTRLVSRNGIDLSQKYSEVHDAFKKLKEDAVIDGEVVALNSSGQPSFQLLQHVSQNKSKLVFCAFDILYLDGKDLRSLPLLERKKILKKVLPKNTHIRYTAHTIGSGIAAFKAAEKAHLEGVMAKRIDSAYESGWRSEAWLKIKTSKRQDAVVIGFTEPKNTRTYIGSLLLALKEGSTWRYVGHTGGSMGGKSLKEVHELLEPLTVAKSVADVPRVDQKSVTWVKPTVVVEVRFTEWTIDGYMRHPVVVGFRDDKPASDVGFEHTATPKQVTNPDKVYWRKEGYTKGDVIQYYEDIAGTILPYLKDRPMVLNRHPGGIDAPNFFQKDTSGINLPDFVRTVKIHSESNDKDIQYIVCDNLETLLYVANLGCIEMNVWNSRVESLDKPDFYIIDLDPGDNTFAEVVEVAQVVHEVLKLSCEDSYPKTSGKTGIHIYVPLHARYSYDQVREFASLVVQLVHKRIPELTSLERSPAKRKDKIYLDWLQNRPGQTLAAPYSLRPAPAAPVSTPLKWSEVKQGLDPKDFTFKNIFTRLKKKGDLWQPVIGKGIDLKESITCLEKLM
jgi:bifunctional non-homologous end joining protein LigD